LGIWVLYNLITNSDFYLTILPDWFCITEAESVYSAVRTESLYKDTYSLQRFNDAHADTLAKKGARITKTHIRETSYHCNKLNIKQMFQSVYRHKLETKFHSFTVHFDSLSFFTPTYALSHTTIYWSFKLY
jgi:hypothetical protein